MNAPLPILVADIGGTNSRLALAGAGGVKVETLRRYKNRDFASFYEIIAKFLAAQNQTICTACCVAVAGPVVSQKVTLTNLDWQVDAAALAAFTHGSHAVLINDLAALGYGIDHLAASGLTPVLPFTNSDHFNGQSLIVGVGTGLNVSIVRKTADGPICFEAELGHSSLPLNLRDILSGYFGTGCAAFRTLEDCFSGRGLSKIHALVSGNSGLSGAEIVAAHRQGDDPDADKTIAIFSELTGALCHELVFHYLPLDGIYFAGSVARGVLGVPSQAGVLPAFMAAFRAPTLFKDQLAHIPVSLINDDAAALAGCLVALKRLAHVDHRVQRENSTR